MKVVEIIVKVLASIFMIPVGILCGLVMGAMLLLLLVLGVPIHFVEEIWNPDELI
jgi:hypothetical protein